jgi:hypothetical protein
MEKYIILHKLNLTWAVLAIRRAFRTALGWLDVSFRVLIPAVGRFTTQRARSGWEMPTANGITML